MHKILKTTKDFAFLNKKMRGIVFGEAGLGKTSQLYGFPEKTTLFCNVENTLLPTLEGSSVYHMITPTRWESIQKLPQLLKDEEFLGFETLFIDSLSAISRLCFCWCKKHPENYIDGKVDTRNLYYMYQDQMSTWINEMLLTINAHIWFTCSLDVSVDEFNRKAYKPLIEGNKVAQEIMSRVDEIFTIACENTISDATCSKRVLITSACNILGLPAKDRSGLLNEKEELPLCEIHHYLCGKLFSTLKPENQPKDTKEQE